MLVHPVIGDAYATALDGAVAGESPGADLPSVALYDPDLLRRFAAVSDGRGTQGRDHPVAVVLTLCAAAVLAGMRSFTAIAGWVADVPAELLVALHGRPAERLSQSLFPSKSTLWRVLSGADAGAVDAAVGAWLHAQAAARDRASPGSAAGQGADETTMVAIAVDGKTVRGAIDADGAQVHLLAAATHGQQLVLGQVEVGVKSNEVRRESPCRIPDLVRRNSEDSSWVRWLTRS
ncbi:MAG: transposase family protein, partial [Pseudonocardiaceae bacterium]